MLIELSRFKGLPIASLDDAQAVGIVTDVLVHPETGELVGCLVQLRGWFAPQRALSARDIASYDPAGIVVRTPDSLVEVQEIVPMYRLTRTQNRWIGKTVESESGEHIGKVADLVINTDLEMLSSIYTADFLKPERVIAREHIVSVTPKRIVVKELMPVRMVRAPTHEATV